MNRNRDRRRGARRAGRRDSPKLPPRAETARLYEVEFVEGMERFVSAELARVLGGRKFALAPGGADGRLSLSGAVDATRLADLGCATAVHAVERFAAPRPKALLGHQNFNRLLDAAKRVTSAHPSGAFRTMRVSAAGRDSAAIRRLRRALSDALGLEDAGGAAAHLNIALRRAADGGGWEALIRLTPTPLSARDWRACNRADALNATVARAMASLSGRRGMARFVNLCCGSGTLMIERAKSGRSERIVGVDSDPSALACARQNIAAAGVGDAVDAVLGDARAAPLPSASFDVAAADLPFGMVDGGAPDLSALYADTLREAARLVARDGALAAITTRRQLFAESLKANAERWRLAAEFPLRLPHKRGYISPSVYLLRRVGG